MDGQFEMSGNGTKGTAPPSSQPPAAASGATAAPPPQPQVARVSDLLQMMAALPDTAPATPKQPRKILVLAKAAGFVHASIPLATRTIEALGRRPARGQRSSLTTRPTSPSENLRQYDAIFLASTTGTFLDDPADPATTTARRKALLDFVRGGKGLAGIHAATDSYHGDAPGAAPARARQPARQAGCRRWRAAMAGLQRA